MSDQPKKRENTQQSLDIERDIQVAAMLNDCHDECCHLIRGNFVPLVKIDTHCKKNREDVKIIGHRAVHYRCHALASMTNDCYNGYCHLSRKKLGSIGKNRRLTRKNGRTTSKK